MFGIKRFWFCWFGCLGITAGLWSRVSEGVDDGDLSRSPVRLKHTHLHASIPRRYYPFSFVYVKRKSNKLIMLYNFQGSKLSPSRHDQIAQWFTVTLSRDELVQGSRCRSEACLSAIANTLKICSKGHNYRTVALNKISMLEIVSRRARCTRAYVSTRWMDLPNPVALSWHLDMSRQTNY